MLTDYIKIILYYLLPKRLLTILVGCFANIRIPAIKNAFIRSFIHKYKVNMAEALKETPEQYETFNTFFIRHLKPESRPIAEAGIISPVDGYISELGSIDSGTLLQAKGRYYSVRDLLAVDEALSSSFDNGLFATLYLSPQDYHRVHMPIEATLKEMIYVPGKLFSVQPASVRLVPKLFSQNERLVVFFETAVGPMAMVLVGATIVGAIGTSWSGDMIRSRQRSHFVYTQDSHRHLSLLQAAEMGYFKLGSTVILLFADKRRVQWQQGLQAGDKIHFGDPLGRCLTG